MTRTDSESHDRSVLDATVKLSTRDWLLLVSVIGAAVLGAVVSFNELKATVVEQISKSTEINARQDRDITNLQTDVRELRGRR